MQLSSWIGSRYPNDVRDANRRLPLSAAAWSQAISAVRLDAFPDGGLSRIRLLGPIDPDARRLAGYRWFNALPEQQAAQTMTEASVPANLQPEIVRLRPLSEAWRNSLAKEGTSVGIAEFVTQLEGAPNS